MTYVCAVVVVVNNNAQIVRPPMKLSVYAKNLQNVETIMLEAKFQAQVIQLARMNGWRVFHPSKMQARDGSWRTALSGDKGWPDLVLAHRERGFIVCELKAERGVLSTEQKEWLFHLAPWAECYVWKPRDLEAIARRLGAKGVRNLGSVG